MPGITDAADRRDFLVLKSIGDALTLAAGDNFKVAFGNSTNQSDYRWGKLHRITLPSVARRAVHDPVAGQPVHLAAARPARHPGRRWRRHVDNAGHNLRADTPDKFTNSVRAGPPLRGPGDLGWLAIREFAARRYQRGPRQQVRAEPALGWLTNDTYPVRHTLLDLVGHIDSITVFVPAGS